MFYILLILFIIFITRVISGGADENYMISVKKSNWKLFENYIIYMAKITGISGDQIKKIKKANTDAEIYKIIGHREYNDKYEKFALSKKIGLLKKFAIELPFKVEKILDIGTEHIYILDALQQEFNAEVWGINIDVGFDHYRELDKKRIIIYDGTNIPFDFKFDLINMTAVMHHIPMDNLKALIKNICKSTKSIFIKDNDLTNDDVINLFIAQHVFFQGGVFNKDQTLGFLNKEITFDLLEKEFAKYNFKCIKSQFDKNFNNNFYAIFMQT